MRLDRRDLPALVTARTTSTTKSTTSSTKRKSTKTSSNEKSPTSSSSLITSSTYSSIITHSTLTTSISSASSSTSTQHVSTSVIQATVVIPNQENTPYNYNFPGDIDGTVYIAFGSVLGFFFFLILLIWSILSFKSWYVARRQTKYRNTLKQRYNNPMGGNGIGMFEDFVPDETIFEETDNWSSQSSDESDISEKIIKQKTSNNNIKHTMNGEELQELFVSPTEVLFRGNNNTNNSGSHITLPVPSGASSPIYTFGLEHMNNSNINMERFVGTPPTIVINNGGSIISDSPSQLNSNNVTPTTKKFRPPSVHLDELLNQHN